MEWWTHFLILSVSLFPWPKFPCRPGGTKERPNEGIWVRFHSVRSPCHQSGRVWVGGKATEGPCREQANQTENLHLQGAECSFRVLLS